MARRRAMGAGNAVRRRAAPPPRRRSSSKGRRPTKGGGRPKGRGRSAPAPPPNIDEEARSKYPQMAWALDLPEIGDILRTAAREGLGPNELQGRIFKTNWWRTTPASVRQWLQQKAMDPATADRERLGVMAEFKSFAAQHLMPTSDQAIAQWADRQDPEGFKDWVRRATKSRFPGLAAAIDAGRTVEEFADPYRQLAAQTLEVNPNAVDLTQPRWQRALNARDPKTGAVGPMSLTDWEATLKTDPTYGWDRTKNAREQAAEFSTKLAQTFGAM